MLGTALLAAAPAVAGMSTAGAFEVPINDYLYATAFSVIGIVARHSLDAAKPDATFNFRTFGIDLLTAPALGIFAYIVCIYIEIGPAIAPGIVVALSFLGPEWVRQALTAMGDTILNRVRSKP